MPLASALAGGPTAFVRADVALDGEPVVGSFTVDGMTFAVTEDGDAVELVGVASGWQQATSSQEGDGSPAAPMLASGPDGTALAVPESVTYEGVSYDVSSIGAYAFYLSGVTSVELPASVVSVDERAFRSSDVASVEVDPDNPSFASFDGILYDASFSRLLLIPGGRTGAARISSKAEEVDARAFSHCVGVTSISVDAGSDSYSSWDGLLYDASGATLLRVPAAATDITIRDGCTAIAAGALEGCVQLASITAPASVTSISLDVFTSVPTVSLPAASAVADDPGASTGATEEPSEQAGSTPASISASTQITAMVALSSAADDLPEVDPSAITVNLPEGADPAIWRSVGFQGTEESSTAAEATLRAGATYEVTASAMPLYAADGKTVAARWSLDSAGTLLVSGVPGQVVSCAFNENSYIEWRSSTYRFSIKKILLDNLDVADASWWFYNMPEVETFELKGTVFSSTTSLHHLLHGCVKLNSVLNFSLTHCKNLTNASCIFMGCAALPAVPPTFRLPGSVTSATHCFFTTPITTLNGFTLPNAIKNTAYMFYNCSILETLPDGFTIPSTVTEATQMFNGCNRLGSLPVGFSIPSTLPAANRDLIFGTNPTAAGLANLQREGRADLEGKVITVYTGSDAITKGLDWSAMGRRLGTQKIILTWNYGGGSLDGAASRITGQAYSSGQKVFIPNSPTRGGYDFNNWYTAEAGGQQISSSTALPASNVTYYAHWSVITYNISYSLDGGMLGVPNPGTYTVETGDIALRNPEKTGYTALGWEVAGASGSGAVTSDSTTTIKQGTYGALACTALWAANAYAIAFDVQGGSALASIRATYDADVTLPAPAARNGYVFQGWNREPDGSGASYQDGVIAKPNLTATANATVTLYAQWEPTISADVPIEVTARVDLLGIEEQQEATGYIESRCGEPLTVADVAFEPLAGATDVFGAASVADVALEVLAAGSTSPDARFKLDASATQSPASAAVFRMASYGTRVPISYRFAIPDELLPSLVETTKPVCAVAYTVALA